jgi:hypothetical protein
MMYSLTRLAYKNKGFMHNDTACIFDARATFSRPSSVGSLVSVRSHVSVRAIVRIANQSQTLSILRHSLRLALSLLGLEDAK